MTDKYGMGMDVIRPPAEANAYIASLTRILLRKGVLTEQDVKMWRQDQEEELKNVAVVVRLMMIEARSMTGARIDPDEAAQYYGFANYREMVKKAIRVMADNPLMDTTTGETAKLVKHLTDIVDGEV